MRALKLTSFANALQQQNAQADCLTLSFDERLALLVTGEVYARNDRKRERLPQPLAGTLTVKALSWLKASLWTIE